MLLLAASHHKLIVTVKGDGDRQTGTRACGNTGVWSSFVTGIRVV